MERECIGVARNPEQMAFGEVSSFECACPVQRKCNGLNALQELDTCFRCRAVEQIVTQILMQLWHMQSMQTQALVDVKCCAQEPTKVALYRVRFAAADIWEGYGDDPDTVDIEIYQPWLEPADSAALGAQRATRCAPDQPSSFDSHVQC